MSTQLRNQETATKAAPSPAQNQFQARPFVEEAEAESRSIDHQHAIGSNTSAPPETPIQPKPNALTGHFFNRVPLHANPVQPKLTIGQPNDQYEQEADQVADRVMKMAAPPDHPSIQRQTDESWMQPMRITPLVRRQVEGEDLQMQPIGFASSQLQRQAEDEPEALQLKPLMGFVQRQEEEDMGTASPLLQRFAAQAPTQQPDTQTSSLENQLSRRQGGGSPLPEDVRAFMEPRFGYDFSHVRVHTDGESVQMNRELNAQAFTHGNNIYFGTGKYNPDANEGKQLLAHELTHVVQQGSKLILQRKPNTPGNASKSSNAAKKKDAFAGKAYNTNTKEGALEFAQDWHTQLLWDYSEYMQEGAELEKKLLTGRTFFIYTEYYWPKLKEQAEKVPPPDIFQATAKAVEDATKDAESEETSAQRLNVESYRTLFPETYAKQYDEEARKLREEGKKDYDQLEQYKLQSVNDKEKFIDWGEYQYYENITADLLTKEAQKIRKGQWDVLNLKYHKLFFSLEAREKARKLAEQEYQAYVARSNDPHGTWEKAHKTHFSSDLEKQSKDVRHDLLSVELFASQLRLKAGRDVLPASVIDAWATAEKTMMTLTPAAAKGEVSTIDRDAAVALILAFYNAFRDAVKSQDKEKTYKIRNEKESYTANPYLSPSYLDLAASQIKTAATVSDWKLTFQYYGNIVKNLDKYIADELTKKGRKEEADQLNTSGSLARELAKVLREHPDTQKVQAVFYPKDELENVGQPGTADFQAKKIPLYFYIYREGSTWSLIDVTTPHKVKINRESGGTATAPPKDLFEELNTKLRFPKGQLHWTLPDGVTWTMPTTEQRRLSEWLTWIGVGAALLALAVATLGASTPATVLFVGSGIVGAAAATADLVEKSEAGVLTTQDIAVNTLSIVANLASAGTVGLGRVVVTGALKTGNAAKLAVLTDRLYAPVALTAATADVASFAVFAAGVWENLEAIDQMPGSEEDRKLSKARLFGQFILMGGITFLSVKGSLPNMMKGRNLHLDLDPNGEIIARPLLSDQELLEASKHLKSPEEVSALLGRKDLPEELIQRLRASVSQAVSIGPVGAEKLEELIAKLRAASKPEEINQILTELNSRSRVGAFLGGSMAASVTAEEAAILNFLDNKILGSLKSASVEELKALTTTFQRLNKSLAPNQINQLMSDLGPDIVKRLAERLDGKPLWDLYQSLGSDTLSTLVKKDLDAYAVRELHRSLELNELKKLAQELDSVQLKQKAEGLIEDRLRKLTQAERDLNINKPIGKGNAATAEVHLSDGYSTSKSGTSRKDSSTPEAKPKPHGGHFEPTRDSHSKRVMHTDPEYKVLSAIADELIKRSANPKELIGQLYLHTEMATCDSCTRIISQFREKFPKISIEVFADHPYPFK